MATNSSQAGYLAPTTSPDYDDQLENILHATIAGITGLSNALVRPRWQPEPPQHPSFSTNWVAFGILDSDQDNFAYQDHDPNGDGTTAIERDETMTVLLSFYGPSANAFANRFSDGMQLEQNRAELDANGIAMVEIQQPLRIPALVKEKWVNRVDVRAILRRRTSRVYQILNVLEAVGVIDNEKYQEPFSVDQP